MRTYLPSVWGDEHSSVYPQDDPRTPAEREAAILAHAERIAREEPRAPPLLSERETLRRACRRWRLPPEWATLPYPAGIPPVRVEAPEPRW